MAGKKGKPIEEEEGESQAPAAVEAVGDAIFVNREKLARARTILELVSGKRVPANEAEADQKDRFSTRFANHEVGAKDKDALRFAYETILGGLVRTPDEQDEADAKATKARAKFKKRAVETPV